MSTLTPGEAREFGETLRIIREALHMTFRRVDEASVASGGTRVSYQYLKNIEEGTRPARDGNVTTVEPSEAVILQLQRLYRLPDRSLDDLLLRARVRSALNQRGISKSDTDSAWKMLATRLGELGTPIHTDRGELINAILNRPREVRVPGRRKAEETGTAR